MLYPLNPKNSYTPENAKRMERMLYVHGYTAPRYPMPATCEFHMSPELMDHWQLAGLIDHNA